MMRLAKDALFALLSPRAGLAEGAAILMYHSVGKNDAFFTVSPETFERQLASLKRRRISVIPLPELVDRLLAGKPVGGCVAITFDDGYRDTYTEALPRLARERFPTTVFLATGGIGGVSLGSRLPMLTREDIAAMRESGLVAFMPHGVSHRNLDELPEEEALREIASAKEAVEALAGSPADIFAWPRGRFTPSLKKRLPALGFRAALTVREGLVAAGSDPYALPRNSVDSGTSTLQFRGKTSRGIARYVALKKCLSLSTS